MINTSSAWHPAKVFVVLLISVLALLWFKHDSVLRYLIETSHFPLEELRQRLNYDFLNQGKKVNQTINEQQQNVLEYVQDSLAERQQTVALRSPSKNQELTHTQSHALVSSHEKVFFAGDSLMQGVAPHVAQQLKNDLEVASIDLSKLGSGLLYNQHFNWAKLIEEHINKDSSIKILAVFVGTNDTWDIYENKKQYRFGSPEWQTLYRNRIQSILRQAQQKNIKVFWLGLPNMKKNSLNDGVQLLNTLFKEEVSQAGQHFIPTQQLLGSQDKEYTKFITQDNGERISVRSGDGIHFSVQGQKIIAKVLYQNITGLKQ